MSHSDEELLRLDVERARERLHSRARDLGDSIRDSIGAADPLAALTGLSLKGPGGVLAAVAAGVLLGAIGPNLSRAREGGSPPPRERSLLATIAVELVPVLAPICIPAIVEALSRPAATADATDRTEPRS